MPLVLVSQLAALALAGCGSTEPGTPTGGSSSGGALATGGQPSGGGSPTGGQTNSGGQATGGQSTSSGGGGSAELPADSTEASIAAYLAADSYKTWRKDPAPRAATTGNPHLGMDAQLQVYMNATAVASYLANMDKPSLERNHTVGSMVVKEVYDDGGTEVARLVSIKTGADRRAFTFYCEGSEAGCGVAGETPPIYGSAESACSGCHGGSIFAPLPAE